MTRTRSHSGLLETSFDDDDEDSVTQDKSCGRKQEKSDFQCQAGSDFETSDVIDVDEALGGTTDTCDTCDDATRVDEALGETIDTCDKGSDPVFDDQQAVLETLEDRLRYIKLS